MSSSEAPVILFYCKDCQWVGVQAVRDGKKYVYSCPECKGKRVSFGTKPAVMEYFHLKEAHVDKALNSNS